VKFLQPTHQKRKSEFVLLAADLNTHYFEFMGGNYNSKKVEGVYNLFTGLDRESQSDCLDLKDTFVHCNGLGCDSKCLPFTYDTQNNEYARSGAFALEPSSVTDYIMLNDINQLKPVEANLVFTERLCEFDEPIHLSDHFGLITRFNINF